MEWNIDLSDLKESAVRRMLREAITTDKNRSLPLHKRKEKLEVEEDDDATKEADDENDKLVELSREHGAPKDVPVTNEDVSEEASEKLEPPKKVAKKAEKIGKPYTPS